MRTSTTSAAVIAIAGLMIVATACGKQRSSDTDSSPAGSATPLTGKEAEQRQLLDRATELADKDIYAAHNELKRIPDDSPLYDSKQMRSVEDRWADAMFDKAESTDDPERERLILNEISETSSVSREKRVRAAELSLHVDNPERPPVAQSAEPAERQPDLRFDEKAMKRTLYDKARSGTATQGELRMLKAICMNDGDRACRKLTITKLRELKNKK